MKKGATLKLQILHQILNDKDIIGIEWKVRRKNYEENFIERTYLKSVISYLAALFPVLDHSLSLKIMTETGDKNPPRIDP